MSSPFLQQWFVQKYIGRFAFTILNFTVFLPRPDIPQMERPWTACQRMASPRKYRNLDSSISLPLHHPSVRLWQIEKSSCTFPYRRTPSFFLNTLHSAGTGEPPLPALTLRGRGFQDTWGVSDFRLCADTVSVQAGRTCLSCPDRTNCTQTYVGILQNDSVIDTPEIW